MGKLFEQFMSYFSNVTDEQLQVDWEELKDFNQYGPLMLLTIEENEYKFSFAKNEKSFCMSNKGENSVFSEYYLAA